MQDYKKCEQDRRRRDIGSGIYYEPLSSNICQFIFHTLVRKKMLGFFSGITSEFNKKRKITWDEKRGIALKADSDELIMLGATVQGKSSIGTILKSNGAIAGINALNADASKISTELGQSIFEIVIGSIEQTIIRIGPLIKFCLVKNYKATEYDLFINDHFKINENGYPKKRFISYSSSETNSSKVIIDSFDLAMGKSNKAASSISIISEKTLYEFSQPTSGPFSLAKKFHNAYLYG